MSVRAVTPYVNRHGLVPYRDLDHHDAWVDEIATAVDEDGLPLNVKPSRLLKSSRSNLPATRSHGSVGRTRTAPRSGDNPPPVPSAGAVPKYQSRPAGTRDGS